MSAALVASGHWRWIAGMLPVGRTRVLNAVAWNRTDLGDLPDLTDPATAGLLPLLCREAHSDPRMRARFSDSRERWEIISGRSSAWLTGSDPHGPTETAAWVAAILAAPRKA